MDSLSRFCYRRDEEDTGEDPKAGDFPCILDIYAHHARNIHNICIYANQDVYAKFSLTCTPDDMISTRIIVGGGKNPQFDESLRIEVPHIGSVLKCEIWMLSRVRNYLEDQLLGFALVPISSIASAAEGRLTEDFTLSSTDLFHSPAGTIQLTLTLQTSSDSQTSVSPKECITSEVVMLDPLELGRIEFPDISIAKENQKMVSEYFETMEFNISSQFMDDYEMAANSPDGSIQNSGPFTSTITSLNDDRNSSNSMEKNPNVETKLPETPTSKCGKEESKISSKEEAGSVFKSSVGDINLEDEQNAMQKQIVDMYMRSMQQFTESLAKMKLPMDLDLPKNDNGGDVIQSHKNVDNVNLDQKRKDGARVFYGSRAFF